jgi:hypothetical protein
VPTAPPTEPEPLEPLPVTRPWWRRPGGLLLGAIVVASFLFWGFAFSPWAKETPPDSLKDPAFAQQAEPRCAAAAALMKQLPPAQTAANPGERADAVDQGTAILADLVAQLRTFTPAVGTDHELVTAWLVDWDSYLANRADYARRVRTDPKARFYVKLRDGQAITTPMDNVATVNHMPSCVTPLDV